MIKEGIGIDIFDPKFSEKNIKFVRADFNNKKLPIESNFVDKIIFLAVLEHLYYFQCCINVCGVFRK